MSKATQIKNINKYMSTFLEGNDELIEKWNSKINQDEFCKIIKVKKEKKETDPNKPKRNKSNYLYFCAEERANIKEKNPEFEPKEITRELGRLWREEMSDEDKEPYNKLAAEDKERFQNEMEGYSGEEKKSGSKGKDPNMPTRGRTAYMLYTMDNRDDVKKENSDLKGREVTAKLGDMWDKVKEEDGDEHKKYVDLAAKEKKEYEEKLLKYKEENGIEDEKKDKKKRSMTGYALYCKENRKETREENSDLKAPDVTKKLREKWNELDEEEQNEYKTRVKSE